MVEPSPTSASIRRKLTVFVTQLSNVTWDNSTRPCVQSVISGVPGWAARAAARKRVRVMAANGIQYLAD